MTHETVDSFDDIEEEWESMLDELREVCAREASRSNSEALSLYQDRLREQFECKMMQPYCMPYVEGG